MCEQADLDCVLTNPAWRHSAVSKADTRFLTNPTQPDKSAPCLVHLLPSIASQTCTFFCAHFSAFRSMLLARCALLRGAPNALACSSDVFGSCAAVSTSRLRLLCGGHDTHWRRAASATNPPCTAICRQGGAPGRRRASRCSRTSQLTTTSRGRSYCNAASSAQREADASGTAPAQPSENEVSCFNSTLTPIFRVMTDTQAGSLLSFM